MSCSRRLGELQSHSECSEGERNLFALPAIEPGLLGRQVCILFTLPATLFRLSLCFILSRSGQIFSHNMPRTLPYKFLEFLFFKIVLNKVLCIKNIWKPGYHNTYDMTCELQLGCHPVAVLQYTFTHRQYIEQHK